MTAKTLGRKGLRLRSMDPAIRGSSIPILMGLARASKMKTTERDD